MEGLPLLDDSGHQCIGRKPCHYKRESQRLKVLIEEHTQRPITTLLDVACGTGLHLVYLKDHYAVEGLDLDPEMLNLARQRHPDVAFHQGDMRTFDLGRRFDVVTCLFAAISYCRSNAELDLTITCMARHAKPGGLVIVEPFTTPEQFTPRYVSAVFVARPDLKISRIHTSEVDGMAMMPFHYPAPIPTPASGELPRFSFTNPVVQLTADHFLNVRA